MSDVEILMFDFGPLHEVRFEVEKELEKLPLQTGDILYRSSNAKGPFGLPFSQLVSLCSKSEYSHAAIALVQDENCFILEINDQGTLMYRVVDWLDTSFKNDFSVYRLRNIDAKIRKQLEDQILTFLANDPDYDFTFSDPNKYYCTEAVATIYKNIGYPLVEPEYIKNLVSAPVYWMLKIGNWFVRLFKKDVSLPFYEKLYYVGNKNHGMMSSEKTELVYYYCKKIEIGREGIEPPLMS